MISQPSSVADFDNPEIAPMIERYMRSGSMDARSRTALVRLLWDFLGTEFGSRQQQYEKFYGGSSFLVKQNVFRNFDFKRATALVDAALNLPPVEIGAAMRRRRCRVAFLLPARGRTRPEEGSTQHEPSPGRASATRRERRGRRFVRLGSPQFANCVATTPSYGTSP